VSITGRFYNLFCSVALKDSAVRGPTLWGRILLTCFLLLPVLGQVNHLENFGDLSDRFWIPGNPQSAAQVPASTFSRPAFESGVSPIRFKARLSKFLPI